MIITHDRSFYSSLVKLSVPIALQNLITFCVGLADNLMIGSLGDSAISGVYMGNQVQTLLQVFSTGIEGAVLVLAAQYWGKRDTDSIKRIVSIGLKFSVVFGLFVSAVCAVSPGWVISLFSPDSAVISNGREYLGVLCYSFVFFCITQSLIASMRSVETANIGMAVSLVTLVVDVVLNYVLIFGKFGFPALGVRGAAIATLTARICECVIMIIYVFAADKKLRISVMDLLTFDKFLLKDFIKYGSPIIAGQIVWACNMMANSVIVGHMGETVTAAVSIANMLNNLAYVTMNGMAAAVGIITGKTVGAGRIDKVKEYAKTVQVIFLVLGIATGLALFLIKNPFISFYNVSDDAGAYARQFINVLSVTMIGTCYQCACLFGLVKSGGDVGFVFKNDTIFVFLVVIPSALISVKLGAQPWITFLCLKSDQILKCFAAAVKINRFNWMKNLTGGDGRIEGS